MKQTAYPCSCSVCRKEYSSLGVDTHYLRIHGTEQDKNLFLHGENKTTKKLKAAYVKEPNRCKCCSVLLNYEKRKNTYCSRSCSAKESSKSRCKDSYKSKKEKVVSCSLCDKNYNVHPKRCASKFVCSECKLKLKAAKSLYAPNKKEVIAMYTGDYSKVWKRPCKHCRSLFCTGVKGVRVCKKCSHLKWNNHKDQYAFKFNVFDYPQLFNLKEIERLGWVSFGGKNGSIKNLKGLSRDHKVSVSDAKKFKYDPYYIAHPCNCEIMPYSMNSKKHDKSSMSYDELVASVKAFDAVGESCGA